MKTRLGLFFFIFLWMTSVPCQAKLLDRIVAVFNEQIISLSEIQRAQSQLKGRSKLAPNLFPKSKYSFREIVNQQINIRIVRAHLQEIGHVVDDSMVENMIAKVKKNFNITTRRLKVELAQEKISFNEYFEILRASREYNIFLNVVIYPLISITEHQIKSYFLQRYSKDNPLTVMYDLTSYGIDKKKVGGKSLNNFKAAVKKYESNGILPSKYVSTQKTDIGLVKEDDLSGKLKNLLRKTNEGAFSRPISKDGDYIIYHVKKKTFAESNFYRKKKQKIHQILFEKEVKRVLLHWLDRQKEKHYVRKIQ